MTAKCYGGDPTASSGQAYRARRSGWKSRREQGADAGVWECVYSAGGVYCGATDGRGVTPIIAGIALFVLIRVNRLRLSFVFEA